MAHGAELLSSIVVGYRRFIWSIDPAPLAGSPDLARHLRDWPAAFGQWVAPQEEALRPLASRWLAHRFGTPMIAGHGQLRDASDSIVQLYGTSLHLAAAMGAALQRPVDRNLYKAAEFFHRTLEMPREALPWFAAAQPSAV